MEDCWKKSTDFCCAGWLMGPVGVTKCIDEKKCQPPHTHTKTHTEKKTHSQESQKSIFLLKQYLSLFIVMHVAFMELFDFLLEKHSAHSSDLVTRTPMSSTQIWIDSKWHPPPSLSFLYTHLIVAPNSTPDHFDYDQINDGEQYNFSHNYIRITVVSTLQVLLHIFDVARMKNSNEMNRIIGSETISKRISVCCLLFVAQRP